MVINHNIPAMFANRQNTINSDNVVNNMEKLASGLRINKAADDASGLAVSEKMRSQIKGLKQAARNTADFVSFIQTTEGYIENTQNILQRVRELAVQSSNGIYTAEDRMQMQVEVSQLIDEIDRVASHAQFNTLNMLTGRYADPSQTDGTVTGSMWVHIGANMDQKERVFIATMTSAGLGLRNPSDNKMMSLSTPAEANSSIGYVDQALKKVSKQRADLGAYQNRLEFAQKALMIGFENLQAAESRIRDTDMAEQSVEFTKNQILQQASTSMLAQANSRPQQVLQLIR